MVVVHAAIPLAMYTSIGPELSELTQRQAITAGKRLSKSLNHYRANVTENASLKAIYSLHETKPNSITHQLGKPKTHLRERDTHTLVSALFTLFD